MIDPIIDRSPAQKRMRMEKIRAELADMGYSIVETEWLKGTLIASRARASRSGAPHRDSRSFKYAEQAAG